MQIIAGKYEVVRELGEGSTGVVYLVRHIDLKIEYALKLLSQNLHSDKTVIERFKDEAAALEALDHPGVVKLRDFGKTADDQYYMTLDFCPGSPLRKLVEERGAFDPGDALRIMIQILDILSTAHEAGIIHRDIKPDNIMLTTDRDGVEVVKILDFGIARLRRRGDIRITIEGVPIGTPEYMSPEQAAGELHIDHRTDLYSSGVLMYELLTGRAPFDSDTVIQILLLHLSQPPPPMNLPLSIPALVENITLKALHKNRDDRFASAAEFKAACEEALELLENDKQEPAQIPQGRVGKILKEVKPGVFIPTPPPERAGSAARILCLDDDEMILDILKHILQREGYEVFTVTDTSLMHHYLFQEQIDLLISDIQMPGIAGTKVCEMLKATMKDLKVILFSNLPQEDVQKASVESQADSWISKHTKPDTWLEVIREVLGR